MKKILTAILLTAISGMAAAEKKMLDHTCFDSWESVTNHQFSRDGKWGAYSVNPQAGDSTLTIYSTFGKTRIEIARGYRPSFSADGKWAVALIRPLYSQTRNARIKGKKGEEMPQDSLAIINLGNANVEKIPSVLSFKLAEKGGEWVAYLSCDTAYISPAALKDKESGRPLIVRQLGGKSEKIVKWVKGFDFSKDGARLALNIKKEDTDSVSTDGVGVMFLPDTSFVLLDRDKRYYSTPVFDETGSKLTYCASSDTIASGTKLTAVYMADLELPMRTPREFRLEMKGEDGRELRPNQFTRPFFSHDSSRLIGGVGAVIAPDDSTKYEFETPALDIWRWDAPYTPPQEHNRLEEAKSLNYPVVIDLKSGSTQLVTDVPLAEVKNPNRWDGDYVLILDPSENIISQQWDYFADKDMTVLNLRNGERKAIGKCYADDGDVSPADRYAVWFRDKHFFTYNFATGKTVNVTENLPEAVWDNTDDHPSPAVPFGNPFWSEGDKELLVYTRHDIWAVDPDGKKDPVCLTGEEGKRRNLRFRYKKTDNEQRYVKPGEEMLLEVFDYKDKYNGLAVMRYNGRGSKPAVEVLDGHAYTQVRKAKDASVYSWQRANFSTMPDIWVSSGTKFYEARQLSHTNPQMKDYRWGTAQLVKWTAYDGKESEGVLYVPDDIDPDKKYPMLCVFYETGSEELYRHYAMEPSWSWVNYPFYVSRGYVIFVPDIHYTPGIPGESCYNYVCSGAEEMCRRYPWIDKDRIGIDGQSWGGYQTAYLVTRTDMFACAGSGAPVSNMTSAFGGIRWESGDSRQAQYEVGQSRIGRNLWESPELYIYNSPVFHADRVDTPLLIMHNDGDGAVPWYQGIEMFMALRRLQKPVWMLQYNGEAHNIRQRKNRKDITVRLQQFFDHYLKGDPMPKWMKEGIPMVRKGQELNY